MFDDCIEPAERDSCRRHDAVFDRFECWKGIVEPGFTANFLGVKTRDYFWKATDDAEALENRFVATTLPALDEGYVEWVDLHRTSTLPRWL